MSKSSLTSFVVKNKIDYYFLVHPDLNFKKDKVILL